MKQRHTMILLGFSTAVCVILRILQLAFTIDSETGFIKQQYSAISVAITFIVCAATAAVAFLVAHANETQARNEVFHPAVAGASIFTGVMFLYQFIIGVTLIGKGSASGIIGVLMALLCAAVFVAYGAKEMFEFKVPSIVLVVPVVYYIVKLITIFVSTAKLALVTENIFTLFTNCVILWFVFEFSKFENQIGEIEKSPKKLFSSGIAVVMMCAITTLPKIILVIFGKMAASHEDIADSLLNLAIAVFVAVYILCNFGDKTKSEKTVYKHLA